MNPKFRLFQEVGYAFLLTSFSTFEVAGHMVVILDDLLKSFFHAQSC